MDGWFETDREEPARVQAAAANRRPQERVGRQLADALVRILEPRGVREIESSTRTTYRRGTYDTEDQLRMEFFDLCGPQNTGRGWT